MKFETPFLWFTQPIKGYPKPWNFFKIDGLMLNAYEIFQNPSMFNSIKNKGVHVFMNFHGLITMDSGGFLFMEKDIIDVDAENILNIYEETKPNFGVILDHPLVPGLPYEELKRRMMKTLENTKRMINSKLTSNPELIPVIHGYNTKQVKFFLNKLNKIREFNIYGIGSLVPSVFNTKGAGSIYNVIEIITYVKSQLVDKIVHVFGVGSSLTMHLMFYAGADSIDSSSWRVKAAFGAIQLPEVGDRYISPRKRHKIYPELKKDELKLVEECKCPACQKEGFERLKNSFSLRAIHNAWVYQTEIEKARKLMKNNEYDQYVKNLIKRTRFAKVLEILEKSRSFRIINTFRK